MYIESPKLEKDPVWFYQDQPMKEKLETMVLNVAFAETKEDGSLKNERSLSVQVPLTKTSDECSNDTRKKLINFLKLLNHVYVFSLASAPSKLNVASMEDLDGHAFLDCCILLRLSFILEQEKASTIFFLLDPSLMHTRGVHFLHFGQPQK
jgi:hypothetical protein